MQPTTFASPVFRGRRFERHALPVEVLPELATYRALIVELARDVFRKHNPSRIRTPKNFADRLVLVVRGGIEEGSAIPVIEREPWINALFSVPDEFDEARDQFNEAIASVARDGVLPPGFPPRAIPLMARLGQYLLPDESVEFRANSSSPAPVFDRAIRHRLAKIASVTYREETEIVGVVEALDARASSFRIRTEEGEVQAPLAPWFEYLASDAWRWRATWRVKVQGVGQFSALGVLEKFTAVNSLDIEEDDELFALRQRGIRSTNPVGRSA